MKLFYSPGACSLASHIILNETGMKFETEKVNTKEKTYAGGDYLKVNPKGYVPALEIKPGEILTEGAVIMQYVADQKPETNLIPKAGTMDRYRCQEWLNYISTEIHKGVSPLFRDTTPEEVKVATRELMAKKFDFLSNHLKNNTFIMGKQFTVADAYLFTVLNWTPRLKIDLTKWPTLMGYYEKVKSRPTTMTAMKSEGLLN